MVEEMEIVANKNHLGTISTKTPINLLVGNALSTYIAKKTAVKESGRASNAIDQMEPHTGQNQSKLERVVKNKNHKAQ